MTDPNHRNMRIATYHGADQDAAQIIAAQQAEIELLTRERDMLSRMQKQMAEIAAERGLKLERLRAALERVVKTSEHYSLGAMYSGERHLDAVRTARNAL